MNIIFKNLCRYNSTDFDYSKRKKRKKNSKITAKASRIEPRENFKKFEFRCDCLISQTLSRFILILPYRGCSITFYTPRSLRAVFWTRALVYENSYAKNFIGRMELSGG